MTGTQAVHRTDLSELGNVARGKVRDVYDLGTSLVMVATDRISAFDVILPDPIPDKGKVLNQTAAFWFETLAEVVPNHVIATDVADFPDALQPYAEILSGRTTLAKKLDMFPVECVARGYLAGSGWKEYRAHGTVCGIPLPEGLRESDRLPEAIFTPATKAVDGHDENIPFEEMVQIVGEEAATTLRDLTLALYGRAADHARDRGIIIADTKFEFGREGDTIVLADEVLTPDSSRFWPADRYEPGRGQPSYDKQFVRDYLETLDWDKTPPGPPLPESIVRETRNKYLEIFKILSGRDLTM
ncbi:MAG: phosphoribosylaminoimidazolesuccinocarboxamide synthase [Planctomycetota bacterium]|nr:phosphoribosylaminoimidazolesuccinocarboxamide synthase [Planctomycetota bacterium]